MVTITVKLPPELASRLAAEARSKRVPKSELVRDSLKQRYARLKKTPRRTVGDLVGHLAGAVKGNLPTDLSTNKKHMEGFGA
jgi:hypothetical protein